MESVRGATDKELTEGLHGEYLPQEEGCGGCHGGCHKENGECCGKGEGNCHKDGEGDCGCGKEGCDCGKN